MRLQSAINYGEKEIMTQKDIDQMSDALRARGLTLDQTNFAVSLVRNAIDTEREECAKACDDFDFNDRVDIDYPKTLPRYCAAKIRARSNAEINGRA